MVETDDRLHSYRNPDTDIDYDRADPKYDANYTKGGFTSNSRSAKTHYCLI